MATPGHLPSDVIAFVHETLIADIPDDVLHFARRCLLDLLGVAAAGRQTELSGIIHSHVRDHMPAGRYRSRVLFGDAVASPAGAALAAGMTIDAIDAHDGHKLTKGHTGAHQLPALLAFTTAHDLESADDFLASLVVGYEFATRAGVALHATAPDYHTSGAWGAVGAAALGARVLGLDHATTFEALGIAEYHGPRSQMMRVIDHPTMLKDGSGWGAMAGVSAAYLAADGFTGAPAVTTNDPAISDIWADLGSRWIIFDQYFKPHPVCRWAQPAVEAALGLCRDHDVDARAVELIEVTTFHEAARLATWQPATTEQAQYSLPFPVAAAVARGRMGVTELTAQALGDPDILRLSERTVITESATYNDAFPANRWAHVELRLTNGDVLTSAPTEPRGDPEAHLSDAEICAKFDELARPTLGADRASQIEEAVWGLGKSVALPELLTLLD